MVRHLMGMHLMGVHLMGMHLMDMYLMSMQLMGVYFLSMHLIGVYLMACISYRRELSIISTNDFVCEVTPHANSPSPELAIEFAPLIHSVANPRSFIGSWHLESVPYYARAVQILCRR